MISKLKRLNIKKMLSLSMSFVLVLNLGVPSYFIKEANAVILEDTSRQVTSTDIPSEAILNKLKVLADKNGDKILILSELITYLGDSNGKLDLTNMDLTDIKGLEYLKSVKSIDLSSNNRLIEIPDNAFAECTSLESIILPDSITAIGNSAFSGCSSLKDINLPNGVTDIKSLAFKNCTSLRNIILPSMIATLGKGAFTASGLTSIEISNPKVIIGESCFNGCESLTQVSLPEGLSNISTECFKLTGIRTIDLPKSINTIGAGAFDRSELDSIDLSNHKLLTSIEGYAFSNSKITNINLPESLMKIGASAFENCYLLTRIKLPSQIDTIENLTFSNCNNLQNVEFTPSIVNGVSQYKLKEIKVKAFTQCISLGNINFLKDLDNLTAIGDLAFSYCSIKLSPVVKDQYGQEMYYGIESVILPESLTTLGVGIFSNCQTLKSANIPNGVEILSDTSFLNCSNLETVTLSSNLKIIGKRSFEGCKSLKDISFPDTLIKIDDYAFLGAANEKVRTIIEKIEDKDVTIKEYSYTGIENIRLPDNINYIGVGAFKDCFNLSNVKLPKYLDKLQNYTFSGCGKSLRDTTGAIVPNSYIGLKIVEFPDKLTEIGTYVFNECVNFSLELGFLPHSITKIGSNSFYNCKSLTSVAMPNSLQSIGAYAFYGCGIKGTLTIPDKIATIESSVFANCGEITSIVFPDGLTKILASSFKNCYKLANVIIPANASITSSGTTSSFYGCDSFGAAIVKQDSKVFDIMENREDVLPISCFSAIKSIEILKEENKDGEIEAEILTDISGKQQVSISGVKPGEVTVKVRGEIKYIAGQNSITKEWVVNSFQSDAYFNVMVSATKCTGVKFDNPLVGVKLNSTTNLKPKIYPEDDVNTTDVYEGTTDLKHWSSSNINVATVDNNTGEVKAVGYGTSIIKLVVGDEESQCIVNVCVPASTITLTKSTTAALGIGGKLSIAKKLTYASTYTSQDIANYPDVVTWTSNNPAVATVDSNGNVTATGIGVATITAKASAGGTSKTCSITVKAPTSYDINVDGTINILDVALVANSYNSLSMSSKYNVKYDLNLDNIIDIYDIVLLKKYVI